MQSAWHGPETTGEPLISTEEDMRSGGRGMPVPQRPHMEGLQPKALAILACQEIVGRDVIGDTHIGRVVLNFGGHAQ